MRLAAACLIFYQTVVGIIYCLMICSFWIGEGIQGILVHAPVRHVIWTLNLSCALVRWPICVNNIQEKIMKQHCLPSKTLTLINHDISITRMELKSILIVEDNLLAQWSLKWLLESLGETVDMANDGEEAIEKIQANHYRLIFMDIDLPGKNGFEVTKIIRGWEKQNIRSPSFIVALSARADKNLEKCCLKAGMDKMFSKPMTAEIAKKLLRKSL